MIYLIEYIKTNKIFALKYIISCLLSTSFIYTAGTHNHLYIFLLLIIPFFIYRNNLNKFLRGTLASDLALSIFFLSFSWIDYSNIVNFRGRAHSLSALIPCLTLFLILDYYEVLKDSNFQIKEIKQKQTYLPATSLVLGILSAINTTIHQTIGIVSSLHFFIIVCFIFINILIYLKFSNDNSFILKYGPKSFFLLTILLCKSKLAIIQTIVIILPFCLQYVVPKKILNKFFLGRYYKYLSKILINLFALSIILINVYSLNYGLLGNNNKFFDKLLSYRLSINSSYLEAYKKLNIVKVSPILIPNREYKILKPLFDESTKNKSFNQMRKNSLSEIYGPNIVNIVMSRMPHNSFIYYLVVHDIKWLVFLNFLIAIVSLGFLYRCEITNLSKFYILIAAISFESIPYLIVIFLILLSYFLIQFSNIKGFKSVSEN